MNELLTALFRACADPDGIDGPFLSDDYTRTEQAETARRALVEATQGMEIDGQIYEYGGAMEEQGFINGAHIVAALLQALGREKGAGQDGGTH